MNVAPRTLEPVIVKDLARKFVFLSGPRQVGKTTLAKKIIREKQGLYLLYDDDEDRRRILTKDYLSAPWVCLDEFHKFPRWKSHIKGVFDKYHETLHLILTGSARLDIFQKSGDSLFGRYYLHHLHPLSLGELNAKNLPPFPQNFLQTHTSLEGIEELSRFSGFPEPFHLQSEKEHLRWSNARRRLLIQEDLRELTHIELIGLVEQLMLFLPNRIGSLFSFRSLAEDIRVSPPTIQNWMEIFERLFIVFKITPYFKNVIRSIRKQPKYFLYDWSQVTDKGCRFENFVAGHLWKAVQVWTDLGEANLSLHFVRDRDHREVDFLIAKDQKPILLVECKISETQISEPLQYFSNRLGCPGVQLTLESGMRKQTGNILLVSADQWLGILP